jgi:2-oxoisovalerate dehydrogenase E1 component
LAEVVTRPHLETPEEIASSIIPPHRAYQSRVLPTKTDRKAVFGSDMRAMAQKQTLSKLINFTLNDLMLEYSDVVMMGEDIGRKGGVYGVTQKLQNRFGRSRVIDTLLDEQSILGLAIGMGQAGFTPIPEIQFLAYMLKTSCAARRQR